MVGGCAYSEEEGEERQLLSGGGGGGVGTGGCWCLLVERFEKGGLGRGVVPYVDECECDCPIENLPFIPDVKYAKSQQIRLTRESSY